jgi:hypothetical protein
LKEERRRFVRWLKAEKRTSAVERPPSPALHPNWFDVLIQAPTARPPDLIYIEREAAALSNDFRKAAAIIDRLPWRMSPAAVKPC